MLRLIHTIAEILVKVADAVSIRAKIAKSLTGKNGINGSGIQAYALNAILQTKSQRSLEKSGAGFILLIVVKNVITILLK